MACARDVDFTSSPPPRPGAQHSLSALGCVGVAAPLSSSSMFFVSNSSHHHRNRCRHDRMYQLHYPPSPPSPPCRQAVSGTTALSHTIAVAATKCYVSSSRHSRQAIMSLPSYHLGHLIIDATAVMEPSLPRRASVLLPCRRQAIAAIAELSCRREAVASLSYALSKLSRRC